MLCMFRFLSFWFRVCSALGPGLGSVLAFPFFRCSFPWCWRRVRGARGVWRWWRRWPPSSLRPSAASGFWGSWSCVPASSFSAFRASAFVWVACPAVVSRFGGVVFSVWVFWSPAPFGATAAVAAGAAAIAAAPAGA